MSFQRPAKREPKPRDEKQRSSPLVLALLIVGGLGLAFLIFSSFYADILWFRSVRLFSVLRTMIGTQTVLLVLFGMLMAVSVGVNMYLAYRSRPELSVLSAEQVSLERYRNSLVPLRRLLLVGVPGGLGLLAGMSAGSRWKEYMLWRYRTPFNVTDPQFGKDISFFTMTLPFLRFMVGFLFSVMLLTLLLTVITHYVYGGLRLQGHGRVSPAANVHLSVLMGLLMLGKAAGYWLDRYVLAVKGDPLVTGFTGLRYRDIYAVLPAKNILVFIALVCAVLFFANVWIRSWTLPVAGLGLLAVSSLLIGGVYPAIVQKFQVDPSALVREQEYIKRNIEATRAAYGIADAEFSDYAGDAPASSDVLEEDAGTLENVRLIDPAVVSPTFRQLQQIRAYYSFPDVLDVDRYPLDGTRGAVVAAREVNLTGVSERNWANDHAVYTHGYGVVAAYDNTATSDGRPSFFASDIPVEGALKITQPRIYFGEESPVFSIVGGPEGSAPRELDYPDDSSATGQRNNTYTGEGGVPLGSLLNKLVFAAKYQDPNIVLSDLVNSETRILFDRDPLTRVRKVAPWLTLDRDPYPIVSGGRILWVVDGYTTSRTYPYSTRTQLADATTDALTASGVTPPLPREQINYLRNSVKATVDAYDGTVKLYAWDTEDPLLTTWSRAFGGVVSAIDDAPEGVVGHMRYPEDMFKVQRTIMSRYHVTDPASFYNGQDFWTIPTDPTNRAVNSPQPPYYLILAMPGLETPSFSLTTTFAPLKRQTLAAFMAVNSTPGPDYGTIRVLQLPRNTTVPGPTQVQNNFESEPAIAQELTLLRRGGADVEFGNLLSLPVGGGLLYVEPVFVKSTQGQGYPLLRKVLAAYGNESVLDDDLAGALTALFGGKASNSDKEEETRTAAQQLADAISEADAAFGEGQKALADGDFAAYGQAQEKLRKALERAKVAQKALTDKGVVAVPSPSPTAATDGAVLTDGTEEGTSSPPAAVEESP
ncbi:MAG: UPF0182 family protein [Candidatus Nanopelagicales bacterium]